MGNSRYRLGFLTWHYFSTSYRKKSSWELPTPVISRNYSGTSMELPQNFPGTFLELPWSFPGTSRNFIGNFPDPLAWHFNLVNWKFPELPKIPSDYDIELCFNFRGRFWNYQKFWETSQSAGKIGTSQKPQIFWHCIIFQLLLVNWKFPELLVTIF